MGSDHLLGELSGIQVGRSTQLVIPYNFGFARSQPLVPHFDVKEAILALKPSFFLPALPLVQRQHRRQEGAPAFKCPQKGPLAARTDAWCSETQG